MRKQGKFAHRLKRVKGSTFPRNVLLFDTETRPVPVSPDKDRQDFLLGHACYLRYERKSLEPVKKEYKEFRSKKEFYSFVETHLKPKQCLYITSANIWFDVRVTSFIKYLLSSGYECVNTFVKGLVHIYIFRCGKIKIVFLNLQNFWPVSVKQIGETIGLHKMEVDYKHDDIEKISKYCRRDLDIIIMAFQLYREFIFEHKLGVFGKTLSSQAFNAFRYRFMRDDIFIHDDEDTIKLERSGYFGGRTECGFIGEIKNTTIYKLDINSMYPYVMRNMKYPVKLEYRGKDCKPEILKGVLNKGCLVANVDLNTTEPVYPFRKDFKVTFPVGVFNTTLCTAGLKYAFEHGHIEKINNIVYYGSKYIFSDFVDYFYGLKSRYKEDKNRSFYWLTKILLNSLYGKFGQKNDLLVHERKCDKRLQERIDFIDGDTGKNYVIMRFGGYERWYELSNSEGLHSFVAVAAHVTEYARMHLWRFIKMVGYGNVYYCDTDSLFINETAKQKLQPYIDENKLGYFSIEEIADSMIIYGLKDYVYNGKVTLKGIRKDAVKVSPNTYRQVMFPGILSELKHGMQKDYFTVYREKRLKRVYDKGIVLPDGKVIPNIISKPI